VSGDSFLGTHFCFGPIRWAAGLLAQLAGQSLDQLKTAQVLRGAAVEQSLDLLDQERQVGRGERDVRRRHAVMLEVRRNVLIRTLCTCYYAPVAILVKLRS